MVYPQGEDCQVLNIWTQHLGAAAKKPVMVWIHGGGYQHGSAVEIFSYDGENLSQFGDVVVVSLNHRLHALGYMDLSAYGEEYRYSGNLGTADIVMALRWIRDNIAAFGGDPGCVTLFGQSGGAGKIQMLLQTPAADGLYHRVCMHSGVAGRSKPDVTPAEAQQVSGYVVRALGLTKERIGEIETVPFHVLAMAICKARAAYEKDTGRRLNWAPVADGSYYVGNGVFCGFRKETRQIPALIGNVLGEFENNTIDPRKSEFGYKATWSEETLQERLHDKFGAATERVCQAFTQAYPGMPLANAMFTSTQWRAAHVEVAKARAAGGSPTYNWLLTLELPADGGSTPWHNADEPFVFHNASYVESTFIPGVTERLEDLMAGAWVAFARTGDPNHPGMPRWEPITPERTATMIFDRVSGMRYDHDTAYVALVNSLAMHDPGRDGPKLSYGGGPRSPYGR
jgi:para-nitrobenzyl esterase